MSDVNAPSPLGVLIVTDDPSLQRLLDLALQKDGFTVHCASTGPQALDVYNQFQHEINVVLLEVDMHRMDGVQTMVALQQIDPRVRCCCMAGGGAKYTVEEMRAWGALHVFSKPFLNITEVGAVLRAIAAA